jgi:hypothetical protein
MQFDFLMCSERSGSNLITKILDAHSQICGPFPTHLLRVMSLNLFRYGDLSRDRNWSIFLEDVENLLNHRIGIWQTDFQASIARDLPRRSLASVYRLVYEQEARAQNKSRVFVKENHLYRYLPYVLSHFADCRFVFFVRDPRDMALTWKKAGTAVGGVRVAAEVWREDQQGSILAHGFLQDQRRVLLLRFEDLLADAQSAVRRLCEFLSVPFEAGMLEFHKKDIVQSNAARLSSWKDLRKPLIKGNCRLYRQQLTTEEIQYVELECREQMAFLGYPCEFEAHPPKEELEKTLPEEPADRALTEGERTIYPDFFAAIERITSRSLQLESGSGQPRQGGSQ